MHQRGEKDPNVAIVWRAFELRPDPVPTLDPNGDYLQTSLGQLGLSRWQNIRHGNKISSGTATVAPRP